MKTSKLSMLAFIFFCIFVLAAAGAANSATQGCSDHLVDPKSSIITYEDVAPAHYVLQDNYGGIGIDHNGWVYHCIDGYYSGIGIEDTAVFRYNSSTGEKQFLGTMREISEAEGNLEPGEEIAKIHAPVMEYNGKMYFASHSFHSKDEIQRGGHFYSYDLTTGMWTDLSKHDSEGVSAPGQGIITMDILRNHNKLVGFTFPKGEIITYDLATKKTTNHGRPISSDPWNVSRHIAATEEGKVYFSYAQYNTPLYEFDVNTGIFTDTGFDIHYGWLAGNTTNKTRTTVYLLDLLGYIYSINVSSGAIAEIGNIKPAEHANYSVSYLRGLALSHDETRLYTIPEIRDTNDNILGTLLYEYEVETGYKKYHINLLELAGIKRYAIGPAMADDGSIFYHNHNYSTNEVKLVKVYSNCNPTVEIIGTWDDGIWYWDVATPDRTQMTSFVTSGDIAAGDFTGDGKADVASVWSAGLWYQNGKTLGWKQVYHTAPDRIAAGDINGDGRDEIIGCGGAWGLGIWVYDIAKSNWTKINHSTPTGAITAGDFNGDGNADVAACWSSGLYWQDVAAGKEYRVYPSSPYRLTAGDITGDGVDELISTWSSGIWYWDVAKSKWIKMWHNMPSGSIAAGDFTGDGIDDVASCWEDYGLWYQDGNTLGWTKVTSTAPYTVTAGDVTGK